MPAELGRKRSCFLGYIINCTINASLSQLEISAWQVIRVVQNLLGAIITLPSWAIGILSFLLGEAGALG